MLDIGRQGILADIFSKPVALDGLSLFRKVNIWLAFVCRGEMKPFATDSEIIKKSLFAAVWIPLASVESSVD